MSRKPAIALVPHTESLADGTSVLQPGDAPGINLDFSKPLLALKSKRGAFDFDQSLFSTTIELIKNESSALYNFGTLLVSKMEEIESEGQTYYWELRKKGISTQE